MFLARKHCFLLPMALKSAVLMVCVLRMTLWPLVSGLLEEARKLLRDEKLIENNLRTDLNLPMRDASITFYNQRVLKLSNSLLLRLELAIFPIFY